MITPSCWIGVVLHHNRNRFKCSHECRNCTPTCRRHRQHVLHIALPSHRCLASHQARGSSGRPGRRRAGDIQLREDTGRVVGVGADSLHGALHRHPVAALRPAGGCSRSFELRFSECLQQRTRRIVELLGRCPVQVTTAFLHVPGGNDHRASNCPEPSRVEFQCGEPTWTL